ncbi:MAG: DUF4339 domain-containing protein [Phycisphaerales bacterium]|nr:DUF4339 domain-containing protein [Phycisphaerales bacterium]
MADGYIYVDDSGAQHGPVTVKQLRALVKAGRIKPNNYVRHSNDQQWTLASDLQIPGVHAATAVTLDNHGQGSDQSGGRGLTGVLFGVFFWICAVIGLLCIAAFVTWICLADDQRIKVHDYVGEKAPWLMIEGDSHSGSASKSNKDQPPASEVSTSEDTTPVASSSGASSWLINADDGVLYTALHRMKETSRVVYEECNPQAIANMSVSQGESLTKRSMDNMCASLLDYLEAMPDYSSAIKEIMTPAQFDKFKLIYNPFQAGGSLWMSVTCCDNRANMLCDDYPGLALPIYKYSESVISIFKDPSLLETLGDS